MVCQRSLDDALSRLEHLGLPSYKIDAPAVKGVRYAPDLPLGLDA